MRVKNFALIIFSSLLVLCLLTGAGAAAVEKVTNGDFSQGTTGWTAGTPSYSGIASGQQGIESSGGQSGAYYRFQIDGGGSGSSPSAGYGSQSLSQSVSDGTINKISFYYSSQYDRQPTSGDFNKPELNVYWQGNLIKKITLDTTVSAANPGGWVSSGPISVSSTGTGGTLQFVVDCGSSSSIYRSIDLGIDTVSILSSGTAPSGASIAGGDSFGQGTTATWTGSVSAGSTPLTYTWAFDGVTVGSGVTLTYPIPQTAATGTHTLSLVVSNAEGQTSTSKSITVTNAVPRIDFVAQPTTAEAGSEILFIITSEDVEATSYAWDFGDGGTSNTRQPSHTYTTEGTYTVTLVASNSGGDTTVTKPQYLTIVAAGTAINPSGAGAQYAPHSVRMVFTNRYGTPVSGLPVTLANAGTGSSPISTILSWFNIGSSDSVTQTQSAVTGVDGSISWIALPQIEYTLTYTYEGQQYSAKMYLQEDNYVVVVGSANTVIIQEGTYELSSHKTDDFTGIVLEWRYHNPLATQISIWATADNETVYGPQVFYGDSLNQSIQLLNTKGVSYKWGFEAQLSDGTVEKGQRGASGTGNPNEPLWDLGLQNFGFGMEWYMYIAFGIMLLCGSLFYFGTTKQGAIIVTLILGNLFVFVGWIPLQYEVMISLAAGLALVAVASKDGNTIQVQSIILLLVLAGMVIGLVNGLGLFGADYLVDPLGDWSFVDTDELTKSFADGGPGNIVDAFLAGVKLLYNIVLSTLELAVCASVILINMGMHPALAIVINGVIWVVIGYWIFTDVVPRFKS